jgi:hypothetical protein
MSYERYKPAPRGYVRHLPTVDQWTNNKFIDKQNLIENSLNSVSVYDENSFVFGNDHFEYLTCSLGIISIKVPSGNKGLYSAADFHKLYFYLNSQRLDQIIKYDYNSNLKNLLYQIERYRKHVPGAWFSTSTTDFFNSMLLNKGYWSNVTEIDLEYYISYNKISYEFNCKHPNYIEPETPSARKNEFTLSNTYRYSTYPEHQESINTFNNKVWTLALERKNRIEFLNSLVEAKMGTKNKKLLTSGSQFNHDINKEILFNNVKEKLIINSKGKVQIVKVFV